MGIEYRQKPDLLLTKEQREAKLSKDAAYKIDSDNRANAFYQKKRTVGVTAQEESEFTATDKQKWEEYEAWAKSQGLYEEVTTEQQITEKLDAVNIVLAEVNILRAEIGMKKLQIKE